MTPFRLLALLLFSAGPAMALDGDRFKLNADSTLTYDDNVVRTSSGVPALSDEILTVGAGAEAHLQNSRQQYDASANLSHGYYRRLSSQDYTATNLNLSAATGIGNAGRLAITAAQAQAVTPLNNLQQLIRNLVTTRTLGLNGSYALDARYTLDAAATRTQTRDDSALLKFNDANTSSESLGVSYALPTGNRVGLRETLARTSYPTPTPILAGPLVSLYDPSNSSRQTTGYGNFEISPITHLSASLSEVSTHYTHLNNQDTHSLFGNLALDIDDGGPLSYGGSVHREQGGQTVLASRVVLTDGVTVHAQWSYSALLQLNTHADLLRRRYSVDLVGFPAHREYERLLGASLVYTPIRVLSLSLNFDGDWRNADPSLFSFRDHRYTLAARLAI